MPAQQRELRKNYIGLVSDKVEDQRAVESQAKPDHRVKNYFRTLWLPYATAMTTQ